MENTDEFSFILKPSEHGVGVYATHDIKAGTHLRLFGDKELLDLEALERPTENIPAYFRDFCISRGEKLICPPDFGHLHIGWYINHSKNFNTVPGEYYEMYALRDIKEGEEILIDYNSLDEPEDNKGDYYKKT